jgi:hypothetical protein
LLGSAYEFHPSFALSVSQVDPLPHQLEAVYDHLLKLPRVQFLLADDAGPGKTIMAGLLIRELRSRGLAQRILVVCPANLCFQWQRELKEKFDEKFLVLKGGRYPRAVRRQPVAGAEKDHYVAGPCQANRDPPPIEASPLGPGHCGRGPPHVLDAAGLAKASTGWERPTLGWQAQY